MTRLDRNIQGFVNALNEIAFNVVPALAYLAISIAVLFRLDARLAGVVLVFAPLPGIIAAYAAPRQTQREKALLERWAGIYSRFTPEHRGVRPHYTSPPRDVGEFAEFCARMTRSYAG